MKLNEDDGGDFFVNTWKFGINEERRGDNSVTLLFNWSEILIHTLSPSFACRKPYPLMNTKNPRFLLSVISINKSILNCDHVFFQPSDSFRSFFNFGIHLILVEESISDLDWRTLKIILLNVVLIFVIVISIMILIRTCILSLNISFLNQVINLYHSQSTQIKKVSSFVSSLNDV